MELNVISEREKSSTKKRFMAGVLSGVVAVCAVQLVVALAGLKLGLLSLNADAPPSAWETRLAGLAVHASIARHATKQSNPSPPTDENLVAGARIYREACARCHGNPTAGPSIYGASFYPPAPHLPGRSTRSTEAELFWIVKYGIRNTAMPAWRRLLSDQDIWQVVAVMKRFDNLSPTVEAEWQRRGGAADQ
jgi:mono/diheme cytochrome c family protein